MVPDALVRLFSAFGAVTSLRIQRRVLAAHVKCGGHGAPCRNLRQGVPVAGWHQNASRVLAHVSCVEEGEQKSTCFL